MKNINPTKTIAWKILQDHFQNIKYTTITELFKKDKNRFKNFAINFENEILFDFSKNIISNKTINYLFNLLKELEYSNSIRDMFYGKNINKTEHRSVLHIALRNHNNNDFIVHNNNIYNDVRNNLSKIKQISNDIINGIWTGYTGKPIKNIINIGIGGSYLGPLMVTEALKSYHNHLNIYFISSLDATQLIHTLKYINPEESIFIVSSKTFTTQETIVNACNIKEWFMENTSNLNINDMFTKHFIGITSNTTDAMTFGIPQQNILPIWNWVGGRFSLWSSIGLPISLLIGFKNFYELLHGAEKMDHHFFYSNINNNIPIIMALISIWYNNFWNAETEAIIPYSYDMRFLPKYLQQLNMESNGKSIDRTKNNIDYQTSPIIWGDIGTEGQHSFFQMLHQGTKIIPCDFIAPVLPHIYLQNNHNILISNYIAQTRALAFGNNITNKNDINEYEICTGNHPSNSIFMRKITPYNLGLLIALYEHKIFIQGIIFNIFSFDQWGVELGKKISNLILEDLNDNVNNINKYDSSTNGLINFYKSFL
ncbi:glucose-6-phosphate isomerase [Enterobacteriaceae endosymbiont of Neohaemonia nigricornis]|uniref:glucose-6-phosphate isomerase n=1 Tax=Enterobacteriaceae endosymbiont of Neohaemonia nigricornis TaxID=2675792 RepID=UPI00144976DF|nr:glucose-6-phosphate isomerase [Enterobacteriaceae endosymbiont of Neohaemonia nigricornis]QJC30492.1 glucose-6-phosphate isomerase [Enterobacteriaceae endosymbiont of Neohaemonia nigricornis]